MVTFYTKFIKEESRKKERKKERKMIIQIASLLILVISGVSMTS